MSPRHQVTLGSKLMGSMQEIVWYTSTEPAKPYNPAITHTPSRTLDQNTTKRTTSWQAIRLAKSIRKHPSGTESALLGMKSWNNPKATDTWPCVVATWEQSHVSLMATLGLLLHGTQQKEYHPPCYSDAQAIPRIQLGPHEATTDNGGGAFPCHWLLELWHQTLCPYFF